MLPPALSTVKPDRVKCAQRSSTKDSSLTRINMGRRTSVTTAYPIEARPQSPKRLSEPDQLTEGSGIAYGPEGAIIGPKGVGREF